MLKLQGEEKQHVLKLLEIKVQEERGGRQGEGKKNKVVLKMGGKSDLLNKIWEGMKAPGKEHGGTMSFIQENEASTPANDRSKREMLSRLEEARDRAKKEVKLLLAGDREQELERLLEALTDELSRLDEELKQLIHNKTMGKEVIEETSSDIQTTTNIAENITKLWKEAKDKHLEKEDDQELRKAEIIRRKEKEDLAEKVKNMIDLLQEEKKKVEENRKKIGEIQERIEKLRKEKVDLQHEKNEHEERQRKAAEEKKVQDGKRRKKLEEQELPSATELRRRTEDGRKRQAENNTQKKVDQLQRI